MDDNNDTIYTVSGAEAEQLLAREKALAAGINPDTGLPIGLKVVSKPPKKNCKKCYGRGHIGWIDGDLGKPYPCVCTIDIVLDEPEPPKEKTVTTPMSEGMPPLKEDTAWTNNNVEPPKASPGI
jgi:hypothetical protein